MSQITVTGVGTSAEQVIANMREQLDAQFGIGNWHLIDPDESVDDDAPFGLAFLGGNPSIELELSQGGTAGRIRVVMHVEAELLAEVALPRSVDRAPR